MPPGESLSSLAEAIQTTAEVLEEGGVKEALNPLEVVEGLKGTAERHAARAGGFGDTPRPKGRGFSP